MYIKKWANALLSNEKMTTKYWSKRQIKGQCLNQFSHQNVDFFFFLILVVYVKHWSAMLMLSKDCGTQRKREIRGGMVQERPENVAPI